MGVDRIKPVMASIWFFVTIDSFFTWNSYGSLMHLLPSIIIIILSVTTSRKNYYRNANIIVFSLFLFMFWWTLRTHASVNGVIIRYFDFIPLAFIAFWPRHQLLKTFNIVRVIFVIYSIGSFFLLVISIAGFLRFVPHFELPAQESLHVLAGFHYNVYGFIVTLSNYVIVVRSCGMTLEPGHFSILLGFIYIIDRLLYSKPNLYLVPGAIATFSTNFFLLLIITETFIFLYSKNHSKKGKYLSYLGILTIFISFILTFLPTSITDEIEHLFYGRSLEKINETFIETNSLISMLDARASDNSVYEYNRLDYVGIIFGGGKLQELLSDYRGMIYQYGIVGLCLSIFIVYSMVRRLDKKVVLIGIFSYLLVLLHRSWMLAYPYIYTLLLFASALSSKEQRWKFEGHLIIKNK